MRARSHDRGSARRARWRSSSPRAIVGTFLSSARPRSTSSTRPGLGRDRRRALRLRRQLRRPLVRPDQLRRGRRVRVGRDDGAARLQAGRPRHLSACCCDHTVGDVSARCWQRSSAPAFAFLVGVPLMRLSGLAAGIATFAVLEITHNLLREWDEDRPRRGTTLSLVPETTGPDAGGDRNRDRDRGRVRLPARAVSAARLRATRRGPGGGAGRRASTCTASDSGRSRSRVGSPGPWRQPTSTCSARSRPTRSTSS